MATILKFAPRLLDVQERDRRADPVTSRRGEVVIFPGIRIEREHFKLSDRLDGPEPGSPGSGRRQRIVK